MNNPYITRSPVKDPGMFYGREEILTRVFRDIARKQVQSRCIIGERRIGKTSLLYQIVNSQVQEKYIESAKSFVFVHSDVTLFPDAPPETFLGEWAKDISRISGQAALTEIGYLSFRQLIQDVTETGYKIIFLLDEFEATITNSQLKRGFFEFLRALTQNYDVSFILFSRTPLQYFLRMDEFTSRFSSPFFNTLNISYLKFLKESEARKLIIEPAQKVGMDLTDFTDFILEQGHYHPFLLQQLSSIVFDFKKSSVIDHKKILKEFKIQTEEFFMYLWQHSDSDEQEALKKLASEDQDIPKIVRDNLDRRSILTEDRSKIFCPLFEEFIKRKI